MRLTTVLRRLLGVIRMHVKDAHLGNTGPLTVRVRPSWRRSRCGVCGRRAPRYDRRPLRQWRHVPWGATPVLLQYAPWRVSCRQCGVRVEEVSWASGRSVFTAPFEELTAYLAQVTDRTTVSRVLGISWQAVGSIVERVVSRQLDESRFDDLRQIGVDEFSYRKRHHYLTLVVDHDRQRVVWAGKGRSAQTLEAFFDRLGPAGCERLQLVTADLAASWQKALRARVPHARLVFDRFHVERLATEAVDEVRRAEQRGADAKTAKTLKGSRYCLLKHPKRLKPGEKRRLAAVPGKSCARPRLRVEGVPGHDPGAGHARRCPRVARPVAGLGVALPPGAVREAGADDPQARGGHPRVSGHPDDERAGRGHQQQAAGDRAPRLRIPLPRCAHLDAVSLLWRHRTGATPTHTRLRRLSFRDTASCPNGNNVNPAMTKHDRPQGMPITVTNMITPAITQPRLIQMPPSTIQIMFPIVLIGLSLALS